jgi:glycosyltransferase involved in cell wall biosynthesis
MDPKVSVIIPTKNRADYLSSAIQSVLDQTFGDFEIIVVDGASTDNTREVIDKFDDQRIRYIREKKDKGASASRNIGIKHSRGRFIAFLDDDDRWMPSKLEKQLDLFNKNPDVGLVYTGLWRFNDSGKTMGRARNLPSVRGNIYRKLFRANYVGGCSTVLVRRECLEKVGLFDENLPAAEDIDLWIRLAKHYKFDYLKEALVLYRVHSKSITLNHRRAARAGTLLYKKYSKELTTSFVDRKTLAKWHHMLGLRHCKCGEMERGKMEFIKAIKNDPLSILYYARLFASLFGPSVFDSLSNLLYSLPTSVRTRVKAFGL